MTENVENVSTNEEINNIDENEETQIKLSDYISDSSKRVIEVFFKNWIKPDSGIDDLLSIVLNDSPEIVSILTDLDGSLVNLKDLTAGLMIGLSIGIRTTSAVTMNTVDSLYTTANSIFYDESESYENGDN